VDGQQAEGEQRVGHEVAVAHGVEAVVERGRETQLDGGEARVEGQRRAGQGAGAQRRHVGPPAGVDQPVDVAGQRPAVGQQVVSQQHRLGPLQVGVAGQVRIAGGPGPVEQHLLQLADPPGDPGQLALGPESQGGDDLVVAAAPGVELGPGVAGQGRDPALDGGVDVLVGGFEGEATGGQLGLDRVERGQHRLGLAGRQQSGPGQPGDVGPAAGQVVGRQPPVERQAHRERQQLLGRSPAEPPVPQRARAARPAPARRGGGLAGGR
jgi:hypothetical protein